MRLFKNLFENMMKGNTDGDPRKIGRQLDEEFEEIKARLAELEKKNK